MKESERLLLGAPQLIRCYGGKGSKLIGPKSSKPRHGPQVQGVHSLGKHHSFAGKVQALDPDPSGWPYPPEKRNKKRGYKCGQQIAYNRASLPEHSQVFTPVK